MLLEFGRKTAHRRVWRGFIVSDTFSDTFSRLARAGLSFLHRHLFARFFVKSHDTGQR